MSPLKRTGTQIIIGCIASAAVVAILSFVTPRQPPFSDAVWYVRMATEGMTGDAVLAAPYAYRPAVPFAVHLLFAGLGLPVESGFALLSILGAVALLTLSFLLARRQGLGILPSLCILSCVGFSFYHVKYALAAACMVDIEAVPLMVAAVWALIEGRYLLSIAVATFGLLFKEFLAVPLAVAFTVLLHQYARERDMRGLALSVAAAAGFGLFFVLPRFVVPVEGLFGDMFMWMPGDRQQLGYIANLRRLLSDPFDPARLANLLFVTLSYWLPALMLLTPGRARVAWTALEGSRMILCGVLILVLCLSAVGGTNQMLFITYSAPVLVVVLAALMRQSPRPVEVILMLCAVLVFNRFWEAIPSFSREFDRAIDIYGGWSTRVNQATLFRSLELVGYLVLAAAARFMPWSRVRPPVRGDRGGMEFQAPDTARPVTAR
ncbi:MAG TPA: hypothetical protein VMM80_05235 [Bacteroidota bacterium]|nr:hypothetical protein [Bacteroidota bacterium]